MFENLYPSMWARDAYAVDYRALYEQGFRGIIFDIDNTLVAPNAPSDERARKLFGDLRDMGFATVILSNNTGRRARVFAEEVGSDVVPGAHKPLPGKYREAMRVMGTVESSTVCIGDQIFTDIFGAGNAHITSILTDPLTHKELFLVQWRRPFEKGIRYRARMRARQEKL